MVDPKLVNLTQEPKKIYDISPALSAQTAVFPGDTPFRRQVSLDRSKGDVITLSSVSTTVHIGAHTDAPNHYHHQGVGIDRRELGPYLGPCQVIEVRIARGERIGIENLPLRIEEIVCPRVLFKTHSFPDPDRWNGDFNSLSAELVTALAEAGVRLVGIDTPSIDPEKDQELLAHQAVYRNNLCVLEGIVLDEVPEGAYILIALPLKLVDADASPVRAVLLPLEIP